MKKSFSIKYIDKVVIIKKNEVLPVKETKISNIEANIDKLFYKKNQITSVLENITKKSKANNPIIKKKVKFLNLLMVIIFFKENTYYKMLNFS